MFPKSGISFLFIYYRMQVRGPPKDGRDTEKPYTPIDIAVNRYTHLTGGGNNSSFSTNVMWLLVKKYPDGWVSSHIHGLRVGDMIHVKGFLSKLPYSANMKKNIGMIAGGTGITPMLQVIRKILSNKEDITRIHLIFANSREDDILLKSELNELALLHSNRFNLSYIVSEVAPDSSWSGHRGLVTPEILRSVMPPPSLDTLIYVCGPPGMLKAVCGNKAADKSQGLVKGMLEYLGYNGQCLSSCFF